MAAPDSTFTTGSAIGQRESLHDVISTLDKDETPFQSTIGSGSAEARREEWQLDDLGAADDTNAQLEGNTFVATAITPTVRVANRCQILDKRFTISNTLEVVKKAGRDSEISYQTVLAGRRLKMDLEKIALKNQASNDESGTTPRRMGGALAWMETNVSRGTTGSSGGYSGSEVVAATDGATRALTETLLLPVIKSAWDAGGRPSVIMVDGAHKQTASQSFTGIATQYNDVKGKIATIVAAADRYRSDFGVMTLVPNRHMSTRDTFIFDPALWRMLWLRKIKRVEMAKIADARSFTLIGEVTLMSKNEAGSAVIADLS